MPSAPRLLTLGVESRVLVGSAVQLGLAGMMGVVGGCRRRPDEPDRWGEWGGGGGGGQYVKGCGRAGRRGLRAESTTQGRVVGLGIRVSLKLVIIVRFHEPIAGIGATRGVSLGGVSKGAKWRRRDTFGTRPSIWDAGPRTNYQR